MQRKKLRSKFLKDPSAANKFSYKQKNWCFHYYEKREKYFANLNEKYVTDNNNFWPTTLRSLIDVPPPSLFSLGKCSSQDMSKSRQ